MFAPSPSRLRKSRATALRTATALDDFYPAADTSMPVRITPFPCCLSSAGETGQDTGKVATHGRACICRVIELPVCRDKTNLLLFLVKRRTPTAIHFACCNMISRTLSTKPSMCTIVRPRWKTQGRSMSRALQKETVELTTRALQSSYSTVWLVGCRAYRTNAYYLR